MRTEARWARGLFWGSLCLFLATSYAGIRSPDAEILFEACDALRARQSFAIEPESAWEGFGIAEGRDGQMYSIFGPLTSMACVPFLVLVDALSPEDIFHHLGTHPAPSHYVPGGLFAALVAEAPADLPAHARRALVAWLFNSLVSAAGVLLFFRIARRFAVGSLAPGLVSLAYAAGSLTWPYAGTFFSEPLAMLLVLASFERLTVTNSQRALVASGVFLGLATWAHITAILFAPFFLALAVHDGRGVSASRTARFAAGLFVVLAGLAVHQFLLYGDPFETGRRSDYGTFTSPWRGLYGLTFSPGKGLFLHVPIAILGIWAFPTFFRRQPRVALVLGSLLVTRWAFIASRSDWHGGFAPGPRLLYLAIPFLLLPLVPWLEARRSRIGGGFAPLALVSVALQWLLVAGEPFAVLHALRIDGLSEGLNVFEEDRLHLDFRYSLLLHIFDGPVGPFLFRWMKRPLALWALGISLAVPIGFLGRKLEEVQDLGLVMKRYFPVPLAAFTLALYGPSLANGFTNWDDPQYVEGNPFATKGLLGIPLAFLGIHEDAYYPVTHAIYSLIQAFFGTSAFAHHAVQVGLFAAGVALLPWALAAFGLPRGAGVAIALLWVVHPMRPESVSWVANLKDTAGFLGLVLAFGFYSQGRRLASTTAFALALLAKSAFFPLAGLFLLLEKRRAGWRDALRRAAPYLAIAGAVALLGAILHALPSESRGRTQPGGSLLGAIPSFLWLPWWYLGRILRLGPPQSVYSFDAVGWVDPRFFFAAGAWALVFAFLWRLPSEKRAPFTLGLAAWILPFLPVTGLVPLVQPVADRYTFLPSLALVSGLVLGFRWLAPRLPRWAPAALFAGVLAGQAFANVPRQLDYRSAIHLWEADLEREPENWTVRFNLAGAYGGEGRWEEAARQLEAAQAIRPSREVEGWLAFARLAQAGVSEERIPLLAERLAQAEDRTPLWLEVAGELVEAGKLAEAREILRRLPEDHAHVVFFSAMLEAAEGRKERALARVEEALRLDARLGPAHLFRVSLLASMGRDEELVALPQPELSSSRDRALLAKERAMAFLRLRRFEEALEATQVEVEAEHRPIFSAARAASLLLLGRAEEALRVAEGGDGPGADRILLRTVIQQARGEG